MKRNKDTVITFRCTQEEKKTILDQACASNLNMSNYIIRETVHKSKKNNVDNMNILRWRSHPISWNRAMESVIESHSSDGGSHDPCRGSQ